MANCSRGHGRSGRPQAGRPASCVPEPPMRRWPHPVEEASSCRPSDGSLHYIRCALSYQNQLLSDIKALLQQLALREDPPESG